jgi:hypothetical protein
MAAVNICSFLVLVLVLVDAFLRVPPVIGVLEHRITKLVNALADDLTAPPTLATLSTYCLNIARLSVYHCQWI